MARPFGEADLAYIRRQRLEGSPFDFPDAVIDGLLASLDAVRGNPGWTVIDDRSDGGFVHVLPADVRGHVTGKVACWCNPRLLRDGPLDEPIVSHRVSEVEGSDDRSDA